MVGDEVVGDDQVYKPVSSEPVDEPELHEAPRMCSGQSFDPFDDPLVDPFADLDDILGTKDSSLNIDKPNESPIHEVNEVVVEELLESDSNDDSGSQSGSESTDDSSSNDSDFREDEYNEVVDVEVDMREFLRCVDRDAEWIGKDTETLNEPETTINPEVDGVDFSDFESASESEDELGRIRKKKLKEVRKSSNPPSQIVGKVHWYVGQLFVTPAEIKELVKLHAIETRRDLFYDKNDLDRIRVKCKGRTPVQSTDVIPPKKPRKKIIVTCPWVLYIPKCINGSWRVTTFKDVHTCLQQRELKWCSSTFLSKHIKDIITSNPEIPSNALKEQLEKEYSLGIKRQTAYRAKKKALSSMKGDEAAQYALLRDYIQELRTKNPNTTVRVEVEPTTNPSGNTRIFKRIYICLGALKAGFKAGLREIIGLDGAHMKKPQNGQILTAVSVDANNGIYPLAYAIVEAETSVSWAWFLECLENDLGLQMYSNFTFISDRQKGLLQTIARMFPSAEHRFCVRHLHENMKSIWRAATYKQLFWKCATRTTVAEFENAMEEMRQLDSACYEWLKQIPPQHWTKSHFTGRAKCDILLNNVCEVFNRRLVDGRDQAIITCLEFIMEYCMKRIVIVQKVAEKSVGPLTPTATKIFEGTKQEASKYVVTWNGGNKYQCSKQSIDRYVVDMNDRTCSCRKWELTGLPCAHGVAAIWNMSLNGMDVGDPEDFVHPAYRLQTWREVYSHKINPISGRKLWRKSPCPTTLLPPLYHKQPGRPRKKRRKSQGEFEGQPAAECVKGGKLTRAGTSKRCGKCKQVGHNARGCGKNGVGGNQN